MVQDWLDELFPEPDCHFIANGYYSWLRSPKDYPMQLDFLVYCGKKMLFAIEIDGKQHQEKAFWQTEEQHTYLTDCDILKKRQMRMLGVPLIHIKNDPSISITKEDFISILYKHGIVPVIPMCMVV